MKLISFDEQFPKKKRKLLVYNANHQVEYDIIYFGNNPITSNNSYLYLITHYTHWMYCELLPTP